MPGKKRPKNDQSETSQNPIGKGKGDDSNKQIAVIGDEDTAIGFGLTGIKYLTVIYENTDDKEIMDHIKKYIQNQRLGFVLINQGIAERIRHNFEQLKLTKPLYPIFIEIPDKHGELPDREDPIKSLIRRAIGMEITKNE